MKNVGHKSSFSQCCTHFGFSSFHYDDAIRYESFHFVSIHANVVVVVVVVNVVFFFFGFLLNFKLLFSFDCECVSLCVCLLGYFVGETLLCLQHVSFSAASRSLFGSSERFVFTLPLGYCVLMTQLKILREIILSNRSEDEGLEFCDVIFQRIQLDSKYWRLM